MKRLFFAIAILPFLLIACTTVTFEEPQPSGSKALKDIPQKLSGHYYDYDNAIDLYITKDIIFTSGIDKDTMSLNQLDENVKIDGDSLINFSNNDKYKINRINDSLFIGLRYRDTLFNIHNMTQLLTKSGDNYFLNYKMGANSWHVSRLFFRNDVVNIAGIQTENELKMMEQITHSEADTTFHVFKPTKKQFKKFVQQNGFINGSTYLRVE